MNSSSRKVHYLESCNVTRAVNLSDDFLQALGYFDLSEMGVLEHSCAPLSTHSKSHRLHMFAKALLTVYQ